MTDTANTNQSPTNEADAMFVTLNMERNGSLCPDFMRMSKKASNAVEYQQSFGIAAVTEPSADPGVLVARPVSLAEAYSCFRSGSGRLCQVLQQQNATQFQLQQENPEAFVAGGLSQIMESKSEDLSPEHEKVEVESRKKAGRKSAFTPELEQQLLDLVKKYGDNDWSKIAEFIPQFNRKQLRERYVNFLKKERTGNEFTAEEDQAIIKLVDNLGRKWEKIAENFPGRTAMVIKNRYSTKLNPKKKGKASRTSLECLQPASSSSCQEDEKALSDRDDPMEQEFDPLSKSASIPAGAKRAWNGDVVFSMEQLSKAASCFAQPQRLEQANEPMQ